MKIPMGKKIFVSYKHKDIQVNDLKIVSFHIDGLGRTIPKFEITTARDYVDRIETLLESKSHIYKGEHDGEDISSLADTTIGSKLGDKIFDSTVTIVLISKGMKDPYTSENDQWIPWEISYSLREQSRTGQNRKTNAVLAVVLPDKTNSYDYFIEEDSCPSCHCTNLNTEFLFQILRENMFNIRKPRFSDCQNHTQSKPMLGYSSYIHCVKWKDFIQNIDGYISIAVDIRSRINDYKVVKTIERC